jgi:hypothetical protein
MGGGPETPAQPMSSKKELVLCTLPIPEDAAKKAIAALKEEFPNVQVEYYYTQHEKSVDVPDGMF